MIQTYGGRWVSHEGRVGVKLDNGIKAFPFDKAAKQFAGGEGDSINSFFTVIPALEIRRSESDGA